MTERQVLQLVAGFGWWPIACAVLVAASGLVWRRGDRTAWTGIAALVGVAAAVVLLRAIVWHATETFAAIGLVKPSGHSALAVVVYGTIALAYARHLPAALRMPVRVICGLLMLAVPSAMVGLGWHTLADVLVGGGAGLAALAGGRRLAQRDAAAPELADGLVLKL